MFSGPKKPYTAVTVQIDRLTSEQYDEDDISGIPDLVDVIRIQGSGPSEAARAIRKKLKYGSAHRQIRALTILDGLIQNAGSRFQRTFVDEPLLERLRLLARDDVVEQQVKQKCKVLFIQWHSNYSSTAGLERIASLYKELPKSQKPIAARQKVLRETDPFEGENEPSPAPTPTSPQAHARKPSSTISSPISPARPIALSSTTSSSFSSKLSKMKKDRSGKAFNLSKEKDNMTTCIANASIASTNLLNGLQLVNREAEKVSENREVLKRFEVCKSLRREILRYIQHVESDDWIGSLVNANDELVKALTAFEIMDKSVSDDSDSDAWENVDPKTRTTRAPSQATIPNLADLSLNDGPSKPSPRPQTVPMPPVVASSSKQHVDEDEDEDEDNPFGDSNAVATPREQRPRAPSVQHSSTSGTSSLGVGDHGETDSLLGMVNRLRHESDSPVDEALHPYTTDEGVADGDDRRESDTSSTTKALEAMIQRVRHDRQRIANTLESYNAEQRIDNTLERSKVEGSDGLPSDPLASSAKTPRRPSLASVAEQQALQRLEQQKVAYCNAGTQTILSGEHLEAFWRGQVLMPQLTEGNAAHTHIPRTRKASWRLLRSLPRTDARRLLRKKQRSCAEQRGLDQPARTSSNPPEPAGEDQSPTAVPDREQSSCNPTESQQAVQTQDEERRLHEEWLDARRNRQWEDYIAQQAPNAPGPRATHAERVFWWWRRHRVSEAARTVLPGANNEAATPQPPACPTLEAEETEVVQAEGDRQFDDLSTQEDDQRPGYSPPVTVTGGNHNRKDSRTASISKSFKSAYKNTIRWNRETYKKAKRAASEGALSIPPPVLDA